MKTNTFNKRAYSLIILIIISIIFELNTIQLSDTNISSLVITFILNFCLVFLSYYVNGIELITYMLFCIIVLTIPITIQFFTGSSYGLLSTTTIQLHYSIFLKYTYIYCAIFLGLSILINLKKQENLLLQLKPLNLNRLNLTFNNLIAIIFTFVAFPRLSLDVSANERFDMLLPGHAWNQLVIVALLFNLHNLKKHTSVKIVYVFVILWFLLNGERADITGLILGIFIYWLATYKENTDNNKIQKIIGIMIIFIFIAVLNFIADIRNGESISLVQSLKSILVTPTTTDVSYILNTVIDFLGKYPTLHGKIFVNNLFSIIPLYDNNVFESVLSFSYPYPGGEPWLAQPLLDWGTWGLMLSPFIDIVLLRLIILKDTQFFKMEYLAFLCLVPRAAWYGRSYTFTTLLFFVPLMYIFNYLINKYIKV